jgi:hypothetical protein
VLVFTKVGFCNSLRTMSASRGIMGTRSHSSIASPSSCNRISMQRWIFSPGALCPGHGVLLGGFVRVGGYVCGRLWSNNMQPCHGIKFCASSDMGSDMGLGVKSCILQIRFKRRWYGSSVGFCISRRSDLTTCIYKYCSSEDGTSMGGLYLGYSLASQ